MKLHLMMPINWRFKSWMMRAQRAKPTVEARSLLKLQKNTAGTDRLIRILKSSVIVLILMIPIS